MDYRFASDLEVLASILLEFGISTPDDLKRILNGGPAVQAEKRAEDLELKLGERQYELSRVLHPASEHWPNTFSWDVLLEDVERLKVANRALITENEELRGGVHKLKEQVTDAKAILDA